MGKLALDEIVNDALDLDPSEWSRFLAARCLRRPDLKAEAEALLSFHRDHRELLQPPSPSALPPFLGSYRIVREIDRGGTGTVYEAERSPGDERIALKLLPPRLASDARWKRRFRREAALLGALDHPHIARVHTIEESDGLLFLTMELLPQGTLVDLLADGPLPLGEALTAGRQISAALEAMHRAGIIHCDLKPRNIAVGRGGVLKVIDLGLARRDGTVGTREVAGTPGYMSPEQVQNLPLGRATDIWAFGCTFFECLSGLPAFGARSATGRMRAVLKRDPPWQHLPADTPAPIRDVLKSCLCRDVAGRLPEIRLARRQIDAELSIREAPVAPRGTDRPTNLPVEIAPLIGRGVEQEQVRRLLLNARLVTLTGMGGMGKTSLALAVGRVLLSRFPDGVWLVDLSSVTKPTQLEAAVAAALGVRQEPKQTLDRAIREHVGERELLVVLDNCEHAVRPAAQMTRQLRGAGPGIRVLATSRAPLNVEGEAIVVVPPLDVPPAGMVDLHELGEVGSVALFVARARSVDPDFSLCEGNAAAVTRICAALDGLPLALELAAARTRLLPPEKIAAGLSRTPLPEGAIRRTLPNSASSLRGLIGGSYRLLEEGERKLLRRLSFFAGGWTLSGAEDVCSGDGIEPWEIAGLQSRLQAQSLVELDLRPRAVTAELRYRMLATVREYAHSRLVPVEARSLQRRHADHFARVARTSAGHLAGPVSEVWSAILDAERENLNCVLDLCAGPHGDASLGQEIVIALEKHWFSRGLWSEWGRHGEALIRRGRAPSAIRAQALNTVGNWHLYRGSLRRAQRLYERALAIARQVRDPAAVARSRHNLGGVALHQGDLQSARRHFEHYLGYHRKNGATDARALNNLGVIADRQGDLDRARGLYEEALEVSKKSGDRPMIARLLNNLGNVAMQREEMTTARRLLEESLALNREMDDRWGAARPLGTLGMLAQEEGDFPAASRLLREALLTCREIGDLNEVRRLLTQLGFLALALGRPEEAARRLAAAEAQRRKIGTWLTPSWQRETDEHVARCRTALGCGFARVWREGLALGIEEAVAEVLEEST